MIVWAKERPARYAGRVIPRFIRIALEVFVEPERIEPER